jgi:hypothetical protein
MAEANRAAARRVKQAGGKTPRKLSDPVPEQLAALDDATRLVALAVQCALVTGARRPKRTAKPDGWTVTGEALSSRLTQVTVTTPRGVRCFLVKLSETSPPQEGTPLMGKSGNSTPSRTEAYPPPGGQGEPQSVRDAYDNLGDKTGGNRDGNWDRD